MQECRKIYSDLWERTLPLMQQGQYETDPLILKPSDERRGLTLRVGLAPEIIEHTTHLLDPLKQRLPNQYYTPTSDLHVTLLTIISCNSDQTHDPQQEDAYGRLIEECLRNAPPPRIFFRGVTVSPSCLLLCGFPEDEGLKQLRNRLRERIKASGLPQSIDFRYPLKTAHATLMRFTKPNQDISGFLHFIRENRSRPLGNQRLSPIELVANDWCHTQDKTRLIQAFNWHCAD